jgi:hypothetical protein
MVKNNAAIIWLSGAVILLLIFGMMACWRLTRKQSWSAAVWLWLLYVPYEVVMQWGILCSGPCDLRIDRVVIYPVLLVVTISAVHHLWSYLMKRQVRDSGAGGRDGDDRYRAAQRRRSEAVLANVHSLQKPTKGRTSAVPRRTSASKDSTAILKE